MKTVEPSSQSRLVLLAVAEDAVRMELRKHLVRGGFSVAEANDANSLKEALGRIRADVAIADSRCALSPWREQDARIPLIALLDSGAGAAQRAHDAGARDFFVHPSDSTLIAERVRFVLRNSAKADAEPIESAGPTTRSAQLDARAAKRLSLESSLARAVERNELLLHYQPRVDVKTGTIVGAEALVRWQHPELGRISPLEFIPLAEETGLIVPIGEWILRSACEQTKRWQSNGLPPFRIAVNLSAVQFRQPDLHERVTQILAASGLEPKWLELELTESLLMRDAEQAVKLLQRFKTLGIHLSIDDFGTGYSSLSYLRRFPIDALKIDQSFVREMTSSSDDAALVTAIILMGRSLHLRVVAEGVETRSQLGLLRILQCDEIQGYLVSRPVPAEEFSKLLTGAVPAAFAA